MPRIITITIISIFLATLLPAEERKPRFTQIDESLAVDISAINVNERIYIGNFFTGLNRKIKRFFPENRRPSTRTDLPVRILFGQEKGEQESDIIILPTRKFINIYLPESFLKNPGNDGILMNKLIAAMILAEGGRIPMGKTAIPYWLSIGVTESISGKFNDPISNAFRIYPELHNLICNGGTLTLSTLITAPQESYSKEGSSLFREAAEILVKELSTLKYPKENPFLEIAILYSKTEVSDPLTAFNKSFRDQILAEEFKTSDSNNTTMTDKEKAETFFRNKLSRYALSYFLPPSPEMSERTFNALLELQLPDGTTQDLAKLPSVLQKMNDKKQQEDFILSIKAKTLKAASSIAPELRQPLNDLRFAIFRFAGNEITAEEFTESINKAGKDFTEKLQSLKKTDKWLTALETEHGLSQEIQKDSGIVRKLNTIERNTRPELNRFLDETGKKFGD